MAGGQRPKYEVATPGPVRHPAPGDLYQNLGGELVSVLAAPAVEGLVRTQTMAGGLLRLVPAWQFVNYRLVVTGAALGEAMTACPADDGLLGLAAVATAATR